MSLSPDELRARDAGARRAAQTIFDRPLVLEAGAGTGKTRTLVARVATWCMGPGWTRAETELRATPLGQAAELPVERIATRVLQRVVAITFTEAAAAEMAERIAETFGKIARDEALVGVDDRLLPGDRQQRCTRARALMCGLDHLVVRTIHAFCRRLLSTYPIEAGVHPNFQVDADGLLQAEVIRDVIEAHLRDAYTDAGDPGFLALAVHRQGPAEINEALQALVRAGVSPAALDAEPFSGEVVEVLTAALATKLRALQRIAGGRLYGQKPRLKRSEAVLDSVAASVTFIENSTSNSREESRHADGGTDSSQRLGALIARLKELWPQENLTRLHDWGKGKLNATEAKALGGLGEELAPCCADLRLVILHLATLDPELLNLGRGVLRPLLAEVQAQLRARGVETFAALLHDAFTLLSRNPAVAERVSTGIDQLLVDEFQDTDQIQCGIIRILALSGATTRRPGLFIVGDPKQSIYGWRNADLRAYDDFVAEVCTHGGEVYQLAVNFRSVPAILDEVEHVAAPVMLAHQGVQPAFQPLVPCERLASAAGFDAGAFAPVEYWVSWQDAGDQMVTSVVAASRIEAAALARDIALLHAEHAVAWSDVAVLMRSTSDIEVYLGALRDAAIPYVVERDRSYFQRREVIEAWALVQCLLEPSDHIALVAFLRSALVGVPDAALIPLWAQQFPALMTELSRPDPERFAHLDRAIATAAAATPSDVPGIERVRGWDTTLRAAVRHLGALRESFRNDPSDLILEKLRTTLLPEATEAARYLGRYRLANLERFFARLQTALENASGDAHAVLRALRLSISAADEAAEARPKDAGEDAVVITSIHQAKGLDFGHVYLVQLHKETRPERKLANDAAEIDGRWEYRLFDTPTPGFAAVEAHRREVEAAERVRTLYVAMTRAKQRLVLAGRWPADGNPPAAAAAKSHIDLLRSRALAPPDLNRAWNTAAESGVAHVDDAQARWVFPALSSAPLQSVAASIDEPFAPRIAAIATANARLRVLCAEARQRSTRRYSAPISEEAHKELHELLARQFDVRTRPETSAGVATADGAEAVALAAGTAVHRALEAFDLERDPDVEIEAQAQSLEVGMPAALDAEQRAQAVARATATLRRFRSGPLWERFVALRAHIVARELPVLLPPLAETGAVGFVSGAIDLLCRDPADGALFIVDYKTDAVATEDQLQERAGVYASQGALYARALQEALGLEHAPRFELWFLHAGVVR